jgi:hypothetical protein
MAIAKKPPGKGQVKSSKDARMAANKGVKAGTVREGAGGKHMRQWNANSARWEIVGSTKKTTSKFLAQKKAAAESTPTKRDTTASEGPKRSIPVVKKPTGKSTAGTYTKSYEPAKKTYSAQPTTPKAQLAQLQRALGFQMAAKRNAEAKKSKTAAEAASLKKINAEIARLKKALGK